MFSKIENKFIILEEKGKKCWVNRYGSLTLFISIAIDFDLLLYLNYWGIL